MSLAQQVAKRLNKVEGRLAGLVEMEVVRELEAMLDMFERKLSSDEYKRVIDLLADEKNFEG